MNDKIKVEEILKKHIEQSGFAADYEHYKKLFPKRVEVMRAAIKEIVELAIDKCAKEAISKDEVVSNCSDHTPYWGACISCGRIDNPDIIIGSIVDKESILQIKQMINYE